MEDLNYLLHREQVELLHAGETECPSARASHQALASAYARRIKEHDHPYRTPSAHSRGPFDPSPFGAAMGHAA